MTSPRRQICGLTVPDTPLVARAMEEARTVSEPYLFNHAVRSWLFAVRYKPSISTVDLLANAPFDE